MRRCSFLPGCYARRGQFSAVPDDRQQLGVAATGGLIYGVATCEFEGCKAVFGVPLVLIGGGALFLLGRD